MTASSSPSPYATDATSGAIDMELFDRRCADLGAVTTEQKAALAGVDWSTIWRFARGDIGPRLDVARRIAANLDVTVDALFPKRSA